MWKKSHQVTQSLPSSWPLAPRPISPESWDAFTRCDKPLPLSHRSPLLSLFLSISLQIKALSAPRRGRACSLAAVPPLNRRGSGVWAREAWVDTDKMHRVSVKEGWSKRGEERRGTGTIECGLWVVGVCSFSVRAVLIGVLFVHCKSKTTSVFQA